MQPEAEAKIRYTAQNAMSGGMASIHIENIANMKTSQNRYDAVVVGAGPNGLAAAITLARAGRSVLVREAHAEVGGGTRTAELTLPGFRHDICSAIHPLSRISPFLRDLPLHDFGLQWVEPPAPLAHPLDDGPAVIVERSAAATAEILKRWGVKRIKFVGLIAAPEGIRAMESAHPDIDIFVAAIDHHLNERAYIVPGLGDAGDRMYGT